MGDSNSRSTRASADVSSSPRVRSSARDADITQQMQITIDSQSFVNLGQLMGSRGSASTSSPAAVSPSATGGGAGVPGGATLNNNTSTNLATFLSEGENDDDSEFDQIFHQVGGSSSGAWSGHELCSSDGEGSVGDREGGQDAADEVHDSDGSDDDSVLPALPRRGPLTAGSPSLGLGLSSDSDRVGVVPGPVVPAASSSNIFNSSAATPEREQQRERVLQLQGDRDVRSPSAWPGGVGSSAGMALGATAGAALRIDYVAPAAPGAGAGAGAGASPLCDKGPASVSTPATHRCSFDEQQDVGGPSRLDHQAAGLVPPPLIGGEGEAPSPAAVGMDPATETSSGSFLRESWLHVPLDNLEDEECSSAGAGNHDTDDTEKEGNSDEPEDLQQHRLEGPAPHGRGGRGENTAARRAIAALGECGDCVVCGFEKAVALAKPPLQKLAGVARLKVEAGEAACLRGREAVLKAVDKVPQAPVRMWLARIAGSLVLGAFLGGAAAYCVLARAATASVSSPSASTEATSPWWKSPSTPLRDSAEAEQQGIGDRLNKALLAARAGDAAAQQSLLEEVRNILAATGRSGGISAEQILRQFNAKRFAEASKAWFAAEGIAGSDPLDPLFFSPPTSPTHKANPSTASQQQQNSASHGEETVLGCSGGTNGDFFCSADDASGAGAGGGAGAGTAPPRPHYKARVSPSFGSGEGSASGRPYRRPCSGGWVC